MAVAKAKVEAVKVREEPGRFTVLMVELCMRVMIRAASGRAHSNNSSSHSNNPGIHNNNRSNSRINGRHQLDHSKTVVGTDRSHR